MRRFIKNITWFCFPLILVLLVPVITLRSYKENFFPIEEQLKSSQPYLIGYAYNEKNYKYLKYKALEQGEKEDVWALGSSRSLQFREEMFSKSFYNAGYTITNIKDFIPFLKTLPSKKYPEVLIINLDQWMFNENYDQLKATPNAVQWTDSYSKYPDYKTIINVWEDLFHSKYPIIHNGDKNIIGLNAIVNNRGFRKDGSMYYGNQIEKLLKGDSTANDFKFKDTFNRIKNGSDRFQYATEFNQKALPEIELLLRFCVEHNIKLIAFLPPYAPTVYDKMKSSGDYLYMDAIQSSLKNRFEKYGFSIYDFTNPRDVNSKDEEFLDGFHGGEKTYARMLLKMAEKDDKLRDYVNAESLDRRVNSVENPLEIYP